MAEYYMRDNQKYSFIDDSSDVDVVPRSCYFTGGSGGDPNGLVNTITTAQQLQQQLQQQPNSNSSAMVDARFQMMERINVRNKTTAYREAVSSIYEANPLSDYYFSAENIYEVQSAIRAQVQTKAGQQFQAPPLNIDDAKRVMRDIYLEFAKDVLSNGCVVNEQAQYLNQKVVAHCAPIVYSEAVSYLKFIHDQNYLANPMTLPLQPDRVPKDLEMRPFF